ncbi:MAG: ATP-binding protein [Leptospiraceae bacterium]|nr:ATP-binding protein [Leptospiraceae bacterium]MCP5496240.1 ATP-binding protein [Leptospiraceae bacterium]
MESETLFIQENLTSYAMFLPPDMDSIKKFRVEFKNSLKQSPFSEQDIYTIQLACDEALTNSITANIKNHCKETIICRWRVEGIKIIIYIVDYGSGIKTEEDTGEGKNGELHSFLQHIVDYQKQNSICLPYSGIERIHKNTGCGLKIIRSLMDTVKIFYHYQGKVSDTTFNSQTDGSILELEYCKK